MKGYRQVLCCLCLKIQFGLLKVRKENRGDATFDPLVDNDFNTLFIRMRCYTILNVPLKLISLSCILPAINAIPDMPC